MGNIAIKIWSKLNKYVKSMGEDMNMGQDVIKNNEVEIVGVKNLVEVRE